MVKQARGRLITTEAGCPASAELYGTERLGSLAACGASGPALSLHGASNQPGGATLASMALPEEGQCFGLELLSAAAAGVHTEPESSSRFIGVTWNKSGSSWGVQLWDPLAKRNWHIGSYATEEDAAKAYDCAAVQANGPGARRNFPEELISEPPATMGEQRKQRSSSLYTGMTWSKAKSAWHVQMRDPLTKRNRHIGYFDVENKAARAYDCAAVQAHGQGIKRNFPGEPISELELAASQKKKKRSSSQYVGVSWSKTKSSWHVRLWEPETKREQHIGCFTSKGDAARAYDCAAVQAHGLDAKRNFPGEAIRELPLYRAHPIRCPTPALLLVSLTLSAPFSNS
ncbi:hypothetical protein FOA52_005739 [Chlamydomonas sp. UWO 241]|nr:hypothetical protein FOA52_005739 [Chlamydomonas sp. UWO 241]